MIGSTMNSAMPAFLLTRVSSLSPMSTATTSTHMSAEYQGIDSKRNTATSPSALLHATSQWLYVLDSTKVGRRRGGPKVPDRPSGHDEQLHHEDLHDDP